MGFHRGRPIAGSVGFPPEPHDDAGVRARPAVLVGVVAPLAVFGVLAYQVATSGRIAIDREILIWLAPHYYAQPFHWIADVLAAIGGEGFAPTPVLLVAAISVALVAWRLFGDAAFFVAAVVPVVAASEILKRAFVRPPLEGGTAVAGYFPSGHAAGSAAVASALVVLSWETRWRSVVAAAVIVFTAAYGVAVVFLQNHYASDVAGGWCLAVAWTTALTALLRRRRP
jgi:membrane-associated phospholipid phosphatase